MVDDTYSQNVKTLEEYHQCVSTGKLPVYRGVRLTSDDKLRRALITQLICLFKIDISSLEQTWNIDFADYFAEELRQLAVMANDGLMTLDKTAIQVLPRGRLLIRNICMVFDSYLRQGQQQRFSKVI
jgi:oxygen-independent coproporphyrinogen-3 oxidase